MNQLIWFSIPGSLIVTALWVSSPGVRHLPLPVVLAMAFPLGFVVQQGFRICYQIRRGAYNARGRRVVEQTAADFGVDSRTAYAIWECVFYDERFSDPFREHCRRMWGFIMSLWSAALSAALACAIVMAAQYAHSKIIYLDWSQWVAVFSAAGVVAAGRAARLATMVNREEIVMAQTQLDLVNGVFQNWKTQEVTRQAKQRAKELMTSE